jgi:hypothetical protein
MHDSLSRYAYDTDKGMQILKLVDTEGKPLGLISWFPVHCTSMNNTNRLISGDNKGYASYRFEKDMNPDALPGKVSHCRRTISSSSWKTISGSLCGSIRERERGRRLTQCPGPPLHRHWPAL